MILRWLSNFPPTLLNAQRAANAERAKLLELQERFESQAGPDEKVPPSAWTDKQQAEWEAQRGRWAALLPALHAEVTAFAVEQGLSRYDVGMDLKRAAQSAKNAAA